MPAATRWESGFALACNRYAYDERPFRVSNSGAVSQINTMTRPIYARDITTSCYLRSIITTIPRCPMRARFGFSAHSLLFGAGRPTGLSRFRNVDPNLISIADKEFFYYRFFFYSFGVLKGIFKNCSVSKKIILLQRKKSTFFLLFTF